MTVHAHIIKRTRPDFPFPESIFTDLTMKELAMYKKQAYSLAKVDWSTLPEETTHVVFYSELIDTKEKAVYADIYLDGTFEQSDDDYFYSHYNRPKQFVIALHRPGYRS